LALSELLEQGSYIDCAFPECFQSAGSLHVLSNERRKLLQALGVERHQVVVESAAQIPRKHAAKR
jgi:hypothetical protein